MARVDSLAAALLRADGGEFGDRVRTALVHEAGRFLRAGGRLSLAEWAAASEETREAFAAAGDRLWGRVAADRPAPGRRPPESDAEAVAALGRAVGLIATAMAVEP